MNQIFYAIIALSIAFAFVTGTPAEVGQAALDSAKSAVTLAIGLVGYMALFLGLMQVVQEAGGLKFMARLIRPILVKLFPDVPADHPAMGAMVMNLAANALGLGNAATPFGLKAMKELNRLNTEKGTATNAMVLFLAINTSGLALLPTGMIGLRALGNSADPAAIFPTTLFATSCSTIAGVLAAMALSRLPIFARSQPAPMSPEQIRADLASTEGQDEDLISNEVKASDWGLLVLCVGAMIALVSAVYVFGEAASAWIVPLLIFGMLTVGIVRGVRVYETFIVGAKEAFSLAVLIIPYLVAILSALGMLRASGGIDKFVELVGPITSAIGLPGEVLPLAILRPLSGSGSYGITADLLTTHGPDSYIGQLASTMNGSTETTFYVLAVYFGSVGASKIRHAVPAGLAADVTGVLASVLAVKLFLG